MTDKPSTDRASDVWVDVHGKPMCWHALCQMCGQPAPTWQIKAVRTRNGTAEVCQACADD